MAGDDRFLLRNWGAPVMDPEVTVDESELVLRHPVFRMGPFGTLKAHPFEGDLTEKGRSSGVTFQISYVDQAGDTQVMPYTLTPNKLHVNNHETREEAYERGLTDGRAELQAEIDEQRAKPTIKPQWLLARVPKTSEYIIANTAVGSVARDVVIEASPLHFTFIGAPQWDDISVPEDTENVDEIGTRKFRGHVNRSGASFGVLAMISWADENGDRWESHNVPIVGTKHGVDF